MKAVSVVLGPPFSCFNEFCLTINRDMGLLMAPAGPGAELLGRNRPRLRSLQPHIPSSLHLRWVLFCVHSVAALLRIFRADVLSMLGSAVALGFQTCVCVGTTPNTGNSQGLCGYTGPESTSVGQKSCLSSWEPFWGAQGSQCWRKSELLCYKCVIL